ncbi:MAG: AEC family transporter [Clostridioides difficile]
MSSLVLNITSPGLILSSVRAPTNGSLSSVIQIFLISIAIYMVLLLWEFYFRGFKVPKEDRNLYQFMTIFSNIGFMGYPVIQSIFGDEAYLRQYVT